MNLQLRRLDGSHFGQRNVSQLHRVPPEIWIKIFLHVTWIPGAFDVSDYRAITAFSRDIHGIITHNRFRHTMDSKLSISLVCWNWHSLVRQTLFEYLLVKSGEQAIRLAAMLEDNAATDLRGRGPGWWTIRLELALEGVHIWTSAHTDAFTRILKHCPNLVVFSTAFCNADAYLFHSRGFIDAMSAFSGPSTLKRLELKGDMTLLKAVISLLALSVEVVWVLPPRSIHSGPKSCRLVLPKLHTLISAFTDASRLTELWEMPSLRTLFMEDLIDLQNCSQTTGHHLLHVWVPNLARVVAPSLRLCPQLHELVVNCRRISDVTVPLFGFSHPSIRSIVLENPDFILPVSCHVDANTFPYFDRCILSALSCLISENRFPSLDCIRFILPLPHENLGEIPFRLSSIWNSWLNLCHGQGIQVQISQGAEEWTADIWRHLSADIIENKLYR